MAKCKLIAEHKVIRRGHTADSFLYQGKKVKTCFGFYDSCTDDPLPECKECFFWERNWWNKSWNNNDGIEGIGGKFL